MEQVETLDSGTNNRLLLAENDGHDDLKTFSIYSSIAKETMKRDLQNNATID
jgi:hypothetical protein